METSTLLLALVIWASAFAGNSQSTWDLWAKGEIEATENAAKILLSTHPDEGHHLLMLTSFVQGQFQSAIDHQIKISRTYSKYDETIMPVVDAFQHLNQFQKAYQFALSENLKQKGLLESLRRMSVSPPKIELQRSTTIPFKTDDPLNQYIPAFEMTVSGQSLVAHFDTGGPFLVMSTVLAKKMGLPLSYHGKGHCNNQNAKVWFTQTDISLVGLRASNLPTMVSDCLDGSVVEEKVIFGTNLLQRFLSTIDYPNKKLVMTPFSQRGKHNFYRENKRPSEKQNFYIWGDHFMFAKGSISGFSSLNFFVDTGLVSFHPDGRQAAFFTSTSKLEGWGYDKQELENNRAVNIIGELKLGKVNQPNHAVVHQKDISFGNFGGVEISGLIGHAFIKNYSWTIDFENMTYEFRQ